MGRGGIEPPTLGLKVRANGLRRPARDGKILQLGRFVAAVSSSEMRPVETSVYAHSYAHLLPRETTRGVSDLATKKQLVARRPADLFGVIRLTSGT